MRHLSQKIREPHYLTFCCVLITKKTLEQVPEIPQDYFMYMEDVHFCNVAKNKGFNLAISKDSLVYHKDSSSTKKIVAKKIYYLTRAKFIFFKRYSPSKFLFLISLFLYILTRVPYYSLKFISNKEKFKSYYKGLFDGIFKK